MTKRNFLLIELMIAIGLVGTLATPLLSLPTYIAKKEIQTFYELERERYADLAFLEVLSRLKEKEIAWSSLKERVADTKPALLMKAVLTIPKFGEKEEEIFYRIWRRGNKVTKEGRVYSVVRCRFTFAGSKKNYDYKVLTSVLMEIEPTDEDDIYEKEEF